MHVKLEISVVIPHHRDVLGLMRAVCSVASQTIRPMEVIVVNDDDLPLSFDLSSRLKSAFTGLVVVETQRCSGGPAAPRNLAIDHAQGQYIVFLDADDLWLPNHLEKLTRIWNLFPDVIVHGHQLCWGFDLNRPFFQPGLSSQTKPGDTFRCLLNRGNSIFLSSSGLPRLLAQDFPFDTTLLWEDFDLWLRLASDGHSFVNSNSCTTLYQIRIGSRSGRRAARKEASQQIISKYFGRRPLFLLPPWLLRNLYF